jgi:hypothetical protein
MKYGETYIRKARPEAFFYMYEAGKNMKESTRGTRPLNAPYRTRARRVLRDDEMIKTCDFAAPVCGRTCDISAATADGQCS